MAFLWFFVEALGKDSTSTSVSSILQLLHLRIIIGFATAYEHELSKVKAPGAVRLGSFVQVVRESAWPSKYRRNHLFLQPLRVWHM